MNFSRRFLLLAGLVAAAVLGFGAYAGIELVSHGRQIAAMNETLERMTNRIDLLNEVAEAASARALRAEENAQAAAKGRAEAEKATAEAQTSAGISAEEARQARDEAEKLRQEREQDLQRLQQALGAIVETRRTAMGLVMNLGADAIQFDFDKATLRPENRELLSRIAGILLTAKGYSIYVYGHTDDVGTAEYNRSLSEQRARTVRDYLAEAGVDPGIISTRGYGKSSPRVSGRSAEARATNRRVEIGIIDVSFDFRGEARH
ncbi:MAG TPA: OmpA family protein [Terriglobia bacterium]|nr:OmpA family protein [Terriglobia bacterium]